jgi:hypothetical protein
VPAAYLAFGPGLRYVSASYGTTVFTLFAAGGWWATCALCAAPPAESRHRAFVLGLCAVAMGIARPEGAFLGLFFLLAALIAPGSRDPRAAVTGFALGFAPLGLAWFAWHWAYFGHPLPNPFYRRGGGLLHPAVLLRSARNVLRLGWPFLAILAGGVASRATRRLALAVLAPVVLFTALWVLLSDEGNYYMRYRYPILPVILVGASQVAALAAASLSSEARTRRLAPAAVVAAVALCPLLAFVEDREFRRIEPRAIGLLDVGERLAPYRGKGYTLAVTEAGLLPLYSGWNAIDTWGLNDAWIAKHGSVTPDYLDRYRPEVVMFHANYSPETRVARGRLGPAWDDMLRTLRSYAEDRDYELAAVFSRNRAESHYYYVRRGFLDHDAIVAAIRGRGEYAWDGQPTTDVTAIARAARR